MSFLNEVKSEKRSIGRRPTKVFEIQEKLGPKDFKQFVVALKDPTISNAAIVRALEKRGVSITLQGLNYLQERIEKYVD